MAVKPSSNNRFGGRSLVSDIAGVGKSNPAKRSLSAADIIKKQQESVQNAYEQAFKSEAEADTAENKTEHTNTLETADTKPVENSQDKSEIKQNLEPNVSTQTTAEEIQNNSNSPQNNDISGYPILEQENHKINTSTIASEITENIVMNQNEAKSDVMEVNTANSNATESNIASPNVELAQKPINSSNTQEKPYSEKPVTEPNYIPHYQQIYAPQPQYSYPQNIQYQNQYGMNPQQPNYQSYQEYYQNPVIIPNTEIQNAELHKTTNYGIFEDYPDINVRLPIKTGGDREMLKKSILESGIADPIIVAPVNDVIRAFQAVQFPVPNYPANVQFIIIAGQNRRSIAKELNVELPFIIKRGLTKEQMDAIGLDTNLLNRQFSAMKPSEQVYIVNRRRALFEQNNTRNIRGKLSEITGYEKTYIYQLLSLVNVKRELLTDFVDPGYISVSGITHLTSVPFKNQELLYDYLVRYNIQKLMASQMKALLQDTTTEWTDTFLNQVLFPNRKKLSNITIRPDQYQNLIPEEDLPRANEIIIAALKEYYHK